MDVSPHSRFIPILMDAFGWLISSTLAGGSPANVWAAIPRFPKPTSLSEILSVSLGYQCPFVLFQRIVSDNVILLMLTNDSAYMIVDASSNHAQIRLSSQKLYAMSTRLSGTSVDIFADALTRLNGIYPLP